MLTTPWYKTPIMILLGFSMGLSPLAIGSQTRPATTNPLPLVSLQGLGLPLDRTIIEELSKEGLVLRQTNGSPRLAINPFPSLGPSILEPFTQARANTVLETLIVMEMPLSLSTNPNIQLSLANTLASFSTMKGIQYWSESRKIMRTFYEESTLIESLQNPRMLADPRYSSVPQAAKLLVQQTDSSFGKNFYSFTLGKIDDNTLMISMKNAKQMWYGVVPIMAEGALNTTMIVEVRGQLLVFYAASGFPVPGLPGLGDKVKSSFQNRTLALFSWFKDQISKSRP